ncbi:MAG TPA: cardiolipin synthase [Ferruginibacter sp.]|nr:cardiolipin synthase [Ferruginibacter sp.]HRO17113.1 cardiolipin synthase [Ferruginibacter sp.]HRQ20049.1 cardiolipin synthase [Ferruginibacter sp.]
MPENWKIFIGAVYVILIILVCLRIIFETRSATKTMAYLLLVLFIPLFGMLFYIAFGINYWKRKLYQRKMDEDELLLKQLKRDVRRYNDSTLKWIDLQNDERGELATMLIKDLQSPLTRNNTVKILLNGEEKFPELLQAILEARHHIHVEYYIFDVDDIGNQVMDALMQKARAGVKVRFIFDDFGSPQIKRKQIKALEEAGVEVFPFYKVHFYLLANRLNYRNHRKIVVIDGKTGFVGGINVSDKYINQTPGKRFWRDTHLRIDGPGVYYLQYLFITDWNFCANRKLNVEEMHFSQFSDAGDDRIVQLVGSGPDSHQPSILFAILQMIYLAKEEILITTPYFIPGESIMHALRVAALSGLKVKLLVPGKSDSRIVNAAARAYYDDLLQAGVEVYCYSKGFVHAKTMVCDGKTAMVGTANMDNRSFDFNFEVNAIVYDTELSSKLRNIFFEDIRDAQPLNPKQWHTRSVWVQLPEKFARLFSPEL